MFENVNPNLNCAPLAAPLPGNSVVVVVDGGRYEVAEGSSEKYSGAAAAQVPTFLPYRFLTEFLLLVCIIFVSASSSCFTLAVPMREVHCVRYAPRAWDPRPL